MIEIAIPGWRKLSLRHAVLDYNGTLARDGAIRKAVCECLNQVAGLLELHVVTADTFGNASTGLASVRCRLSTLAPGRQAEAKQRYVRELGCAETVAVGNGRNDRLMLAEAALGIAIVGSEGAAAETMSAAAVVCSDILDALALLIHPQRLVATLRS